MILQLHTFLFADLVGFTGFTSRHGDERAADLAVCFQERVRALAAELGCHVVKTIGDAVMVRSEDGDAAIALARAILDLVAEAGLPLARVGLDTGPAVERNGDWYGSTVNTASRVTAAAGAGELLMTERAREACAGLGCVKLRERGVRTLAGLPAHPLYGEARALADPATGRAAPAIGSARARRGGVTLDVHHAALVRAHAIVRWPSRTSTAKRSLRTSRRSALTEQVAPSRALATCFTQIEKPTLASPLGRCSRASIAALRSIIAIMEGVDRTRTASEPPTSVSRRSPTTEASVRASPGCSATGGR